jgi:predicted PurR-regulated permease PerM
MTEPRPRHAREIRLPSADRAVLTGLAILGMVLMGALIYPFASALLFAAVLAGAFYPMFERLTARLWNRPAIAAALITFMVGAFVATPTLWLGIRIGDEVLQGAGSVTRALKDGGGVPELVDLLPPSIQARVRAAINKLPGGNEQIESLADNRSGAAAAVVTAGVMKAAGVAVDFTLMLVAMFFLLQDGLKLVQWIATVAPLPEQQILDICSDFRNVSAAILLSSLGTAGVQSAAALAGYLATGVPQPAFFTFVTFIVAFIPALGASSVVLAVAGLLFFNGHSEPALYLALWGIVVVSTIDNLVKPWLLKGRMEIHGGLIFFALLGGMVTFGPVGLVAGPLILSFFLAVVRLARHEPRAAAA